MNKKIGELLEKEEFDAAIKAASELSDEFKYAEAIEAYEAIHESVADKFGISSWKAIHCLRLLAYVYWCSGDYEKSLTMNKTVLEWFEQKDDLKDEDALRAMKALIDIYNNYGRYEEAYNLSVKAVGIAISEYGEESELLCSFLKSLGDCCIHTGKDEEAVQHYNHFLNIANKIEKINKDTIALVYDGLGYAYEYTGKFQESEKSFKEGLKLLQSVYDHDTDNILLILNSLGNLYSDINRFDEAMEIRKDVLERAEKLYGYDHPNVKVAASNLADSYALSGDYETAIDLFQECIKWCEEKYGSDHRETIRNKSKYSKMLRRTGRFREAMKTAEEVYCARAETLGEEHVYTIISLADLAYCYADQNYLDNAKEIFTRTNSYFEKNFPNSWDQLVSLSNYLNILVMNGEYDRVLQESERWFEINKTLDEPIDEDFICSVVSDAYMGLKQYDEAEKWQKKSYDIALNRYGEGHDCSNAVLYDLALIKYKQGEYDEAYRLCSKSVSNQKFRCFYLELKRNILFAMTETGRGNYEKSAEITERFLNDPETVKYDTEYARLCYAAAGNYKALKQYELAAEYAKKSAEIRRDIFDKNTEESEMLLSEIEALISTADLSR